MDATALHALACSTALLPVAPTSRQRRMQARAHAPNVHTARQPAGQQTSTILKCHGNCRQSCMHVSRMCAWTTTLPTQMHECTISIGVERVCSALPFAVPSSTPQQAASCHAIKTIAVCCAASASGELGTGREWTRHRTTRQPTWGSFLRFTFQHSHSLAERNITEACAAQSRTITAPPAAH